MTLGTIAEGKNGTGVKGNGGKPYFRLDLAPGHFGSALSGAFSGGKQLVTAGSVSFSGSVTSRGTFKSIKTPVPGAFSGSGSWNCHGIFVKD